MKTKEPSKLERQVLSVLWERGGATVRQLLDAMPDGKKRAYTTILSVLQVMEKKGFVAHTQEGNTHIYSARISREKVSAPLLRGLVRDVFGGSPAAALQHLLSGDGVSRDELDEVKRLIADYERERDGGSDTRRKENA
jgi:predicted transcriptional regulator